MRAALFIALGFALAGCTAAPPGGDPAVTVALHNEGARPMQCRIQFGHWVDRDLGVLAPGAAARFQIQQQPKDGALYVERDDGQRKMMIENIFCNAPNDLQATVGQVDLAPARVARMRAVDAGCTLPANGHVQCRAVVLKE
ncbi:MAG TPA: hypothetical protein VHE77_12535 [Dongiaceae bacterium]|jgi:hypothetical protein|nr:hypothetical protein [Dongiaceae bacterium]